MVKNDGTFSQFWIGYASADTLGMPKPVDALESESSSQPTLVRTEMAADVNIRRLVTSSRGAGQVAQAWIWSRDLEDDEIAELWVITKERYEVLPSQS